MTAKSATHDLSLADVRHLAEEAYIPFADIKRAIMWPTNGSRMENDAEHSFSIAFTAAAIGARLGLDPAKIALYATFHDFTERYAGDTSVWDEEGLKTKHAREAASNKQIEVNFSRTPLITSAISAYERQEDEESKFVYGI